MWTDRRSVRTAILLASCLILLINFLTYTGPRVLGWSGPGKQVYVVAKKDIAVEKWLDWSKSTIKKGTTLKVAFQNNESYYLIPVCGSDETQILVVDYSQLAESIEFVTKFKTLKESFFTTAPEPSSVKRAPVKAGSQVVAKGVLGDWLYCQLDSKVYGWLRANAVSIPSVKIAQDTTLSEFSDLAKSDINVSKGTQAKILGEYGSAALVQIQKDEKSLLGFVPKRVLEVADSK